MKSKIAVLSVMVILLLIGGVSSLAYASCVRSISYTVFNNEPLTSYALDKNYTKGFIATVVNKLTYNTTTNKAAIVRFVGNADPASGEHLELSFWANGELHIWFNDGTSNVEIGAGSWVSGNKTTVTITQDGILTVKDKDGKAIVQNYGLGDFTLYFVGGHGETTASIATAGYVTISVDGTSSDVTYSINVWIPIIVTFAMLGMALGLIKKFGS